MAIPLIRICRTAHIKTFVVLVPLLLDSDPDVRIIALAAINGTSDARLLDAVARTLDAEPDARAAAAAIDVLYGAGDTRLRSVLPRLRARFPADPFVDFMADLLGAGPSGDAR